uniref:Uncharacterized protein n=1 Tax=Trichuris muris TaxID=70415 RepID=A0A5S6QKC0_TRIMR
MQSGKWYTIGDSSQLNWYTLRHSGRHVATGQRAYNGAQHRQSAAGRGRSIKFSHAVTKGTRPKSPQDPGTLRRQTAICQEGKGRPGGQTRTTILANGTAIQPFNCGAFVERKKKNNNCTFFS